VVAYMHRGGGRTRLAVHEVGCLPGHEAAISDMMLRAARSAAREKITDFVGALPEEPEIESALSLILEKPERRTSDRVMFRIINQPRLFHRILPELSARVAPSCGAMSQEDRQGAPEGELAIETEFGRVDLGIRPGRVEFVRHGEREVVRLTQEQLFYLLFGYKNGPVEAGVKGSSRTLDLLSILFPKQPSIYWMLDHF